MTEKERRYLELTHKQILNGYTFTEEEAYFVREVEREFELRDDESKKLDNIDGG